MGNQLNSIQIEGNLTRAVELRYTPKGVPVATFGVACNRSFKQGEEKKEEVCFVDVVVFNKIAEFCSQYIEKGSRVIVSGRLQQRRWEAEDGQKRSKHEIMAHEILFRSVRHAQPEGNGEQTDHPAYVEEDA